MANQREHSKQNWISEGTIAEINAGSLQRIADATEVMAGNFIALQDDRDKYKRWCKEDRETIVMLSRQISALKGVITKMKKKQQ